MFGVVPGEIHKQHTEKNIITRCPFNTTNHPYDFFSMLNVYKTINN